MPVGIEGQELSLPVLRGLITYLVINENQHAGLEIGLHDLAPSVILFLFLSASAKVRNTGLLSPRRDILSLPSKVHPS